MPKACLIRACYLHDVFAAAARVDELRPLAQLRVLLHHFLEWGEETSFGAVARSTRVQYKME